jgi:hypothetical protein
VPDGITLPPRPSRLQAIAACWTYAAMLANQLGASSSCVVHHRMRLRIMYLTFKNRDLVSHGKRRACVSARGSDTTYRSSYDGHTIPRVFRREWLHAKQSWGPRRDAGGVTITCERDHNMRTWTTSVAFVSWVQHSFRGQEIDLRSSLRPPSALRAASCGTPPEVASGPAQTHQKPP